MKAKKILTIVLVLLFLLGLLYVLGVFDSGLLVEDTAAGQISQSQSVPADSQDATFNLIDSADETENLEEGFNELDSEYVNYTFRNIKYLNEHFEKHGIEMGFSSAAEYQQAASDVVNNSNALHKLEAEDGDDVYYLEATNEFVIVSKDGYLRTYFLPNAGKAYFDRQ